MKPALFIPLKAEHFDRFADGSKRIERRVVGKKWNAGVCHIGRDVVLSRGYGKAHRLFGVIVSIGIKPFDQVDDIHHQALIDCYGAGVVRERILEIEISVEGASRGH